AQGQWLEVAATKQREALIMQRFEDALAAPASGRARIDEIRASLGVSKPTLQSYCRQFIGMGPTRYAALRRIGRVRSALLHADPRSASIAEIARLHGFATTALL